ncbi:hypothetical protein N7490_002117 [Penicillium lividum]|nr:hypothetical protein N7490_002117 [Penicillium lividum]
MTWLSPASHEEYDVLSAGCAWDLSTADNPHIPSFAPIDRPFAASLQAILNRSFMPPKTPDDLDYEFMAHLYERLLNAEPYESHMALHALNILQQDERMPESSRDEIRKFFQHSSEIMAISWGIYKDFKQASASLEFIQDKQFLLDTASFAVCGCPSDCFVQLVRSKAISASGFNSAGQSYFRLALCENRVDIACELLSEMSVEHIFEPTSIMADDWQQSIFEMSVMNSELFNACWTKIESKPDLDLSNVLKHEHYASVCLFATEDLAIRMLARGIDLVSTVHTLPHITWPAMAQYHPSPASFFDWLMQRECWPFSTAAGPDTPLLIAVQHDRFEATNWLLWHTFDVYEQRICAVVAAVRQTNDSAYILDFVVKRMSSGVPPHPHNWPHDIAGEVIQAACNQNQMGRAENLEMIQDLAIRKLESVKGSAPDLLSYSKESLSSAKEAGLTDLVDFLRAGNKEAWKTLPDYC